MTVLPRFKYFVSLRSLIRDLMSLSIANMNDRAEVKKFEAELCSYFNRSHCMTASSYRMCVYYYLKSLKLRPGDEVLLGPITIADLINVILILDLKPVFVDIDPQTHNICLDSLKSSKSKKSKVLIMTYLSGMVGETSEVLKLCKENEIKVIEDISQAYGSRLCEDKDPYDGDIQIGSLSSGKLISTYTGGFALTNDKLVLDLINNEIKEEISPPKIRFLSEVLTNIKINIATSKTIFPFVYLLFSFLWKFSPNSMKKLTNTKFHTRSEKYDVFFDDFPIRRKEIPMGWKTFMCSWQARVGMRYLSEISKRNKRRQELGSIFYSSLAEEVKSRIPRLALKEGFNFYHIPFSLKGDKSSELIELFNIGVDSEGYGLNFCSEEKAFDEYCKKLKGATHVKKHSVFLPLHESYSKKSMLIIAERLNRLFSEEVENV